MNLKPPTISSNGLSEGGRSLGNHMNVHVGINAKNRKGFLKQLNSAKRFLPKKIWLHVDVSDPEFSSFRSYFDFDTLKKYSSRFNFEAHLMLPDKKIYRYLKKPLKKIWVHVSAVRDWDELIKKAKKLKISVGAAIGIKEEKYKNKIPSDTNAIMVLAVTPGPSGQKFNKKALNMISFLRKKYPRATIFIDGGINLKIAKLLKQKGASEILSTSYIWQSENPLRAYKQLRSI